MKLRPLYLYKLLLFLFILLSYVSFPILAQTTILPWWKKTTVYQIYPRSFYDSNGDGIGDLNGIIEKLDYIKELGFETIWISPFFQSPQKDFGYDISNYYTISPEYGDTTNCKQLIAEVHKRNMKIIFDLVMNHTSDEHEWFKNSVAKKEKSDWYIWHVGRGKNGKRKPNNWKSMVGGSGWHYCKERKEYYWASFLDFQPDLNYYNPEVKQAMLNMVKHWLKKGVDGFRLDIFNAIYEDTSFRNNPVSLKIVPNETNPSGFLQQPKYTIDNKNSFTFATELRKTVDSSGEKFLVGEVFGNVATLKQYCYYNNQPGLNSVFLFKTLNTSLKAKKYHKLLLDFENNFAAPFIPTYVYSNHDRKRSISRHKNKIEKARLLALFQYTVRGIPFTYYGEELGMPQQNISLKNGKDPLAQRLKWMPQFIANLSKEAINRDGCRTPMLWNDSINAGFSSGTPWLPISSNYKQLSVSKQKANNQSLLNFYQNILRLRNSIPALNSGQLSLANEFCTKHTIAYYRILNTEKYLIVLNMSKQVNKMAFPKGKTIFRISDLNEPWLGPFDGVIIKIE